MPRRLPFTYPQTDRWLGDVYIQIVRALEERNWSVPGVCVEFRVNGTGEGKNHAVEAIYTENSAIRFDTDVRVSRVTIPRKELLVDGNDSCLYLYLYVGGNWPAHKLDFFNFKWRRPSLTTTHIVYRRRWEEEDWESGFAPFVFEDRQGVECDPGNGQPSRFSHEEIISAINTELQGLLRYILAYPVPTERIDIFAEADLPVPAEFSQLFTLVDTQGAWRTCFGRSDSAYLDPNQRYALRPDYSWVAQVGRRLGLQGNPVVCSIGEIDNTTPPERFPIQDYDVLDGERFVGRVTLNRANEVYVIEQADYERFIADAYRVSRQVEDSVRLIPLGAYYADFERPVVLVARELDLDEVEFVSGPWPAYQHLLWIRQDKRVWPLFDEVLQSGSDESKDALVRCLLRHKHARRRAGVRWYHWRKELRMWRFLYAVTRAGQDSLRLGLFS